MQSEPRVCLCCMVRTPLKKIPKGYSTMIFFFSMLLFQYVIDFLFIFPGMNSSNHYNYSRIRAQEYKARSGSRT